MSSLRFEFEGKWYEMNGEDRTPREGEHYLVLNRVHYCSQPGAIIPYTILREIKGAIVMKKKKLAIDQEVENAARTYVAVQLEVMRRYGSAPNLSEEQMEQLVYDCAEPAQIIRNWKLKESGEREGVKP